MSSFQYPSDMEKWHDYQIDSQREISRLLRASCEQKNVLKMSVAAPESEEVAIQILAVDVKNNEVIIERPACEEQVQRIMQAPIVSCETTLDKVRLLFAIEYIDECEYQKRPAFSFTAPPNLIRLQRREWFRVEPPIGDAVRCRIQVPQNFGGGSCLLPVADISGGGLALLDEGHVLKCIVGSMFGDCALYLPDATTVKTGLQVKNLSIRDNSDGLSPRRVGCQFFRPSATLAERVQRYIMKLEAVRW